MGTECVRRLRVLEIEDLYHNDISLIDSIHTLTIKVPGYSSPHNIGAWCYVPLSDKTVENKTTEGRIRFVRAVVSWLVTVKDAGQSPKTIKTNFAQFQLFVKWCDKQAFDYLSSNRNVARGFEEYTEYLIHKYTTNQLSINTAHAYQSVARDALSIMLCDKYEARIQAVYRIKRSLPHTITTKPPAQTLASMNIKLLYAVFNSLSDFIIQAKPFPLMLDLEHDKFCLFPIKDAASVPTSSGVGADHSANGRKFFSYNFSAGRLSTFEEVVEEWSKQRLRIFPNCDVRHSMRTASLNLERANSELHHPSRVRIYKMAMSCFMMLFISATGMNLAQVITLKMSDFTKHDDNTISFEAMKNRAREKAVTYSLGKKVSAEFIKFLNLRQFFIQTLGYSNCNQIFFEPDFDRFKKYKMTFFTKLDVAIRSWFNFESLVKPKEWRAFKAHYVINKYGFIKAAAILQNRPSTILKSYSSTPESSNTPTIYTFFENYSNILIAGQSDKLDSVAVGKCSSIGEPIPFTLETDIAPNCKSHEGCLFCENYRVHADITDVSKLLSFKYVLSETIHLYKNKKEFEHRHDAIFERIEQIIKRIEEIGDVPKARIFKTREDIQHGNISPYWRRKMEFLIDLDLV